MKKIKIAIAAFLCAATLAGCGNSGVQQLTYTPNTTTTSVSTDAPAVPSPEPINTSVTNVEPDLPLAPTTEEFGPSVNRFGSELYDRIKNDENVFFSPYSIDIALSMLDNAAGGTNKSELEAVLGISDLNTRNQDIQSFAASFNDPKAKLETANSVWISDVMQIKPTANDVFLMPLEKFYSAEIFKADFMDGNTVKQVNGWISDKTDKMIPSMLDEIPPETVMMLVNAVYFDGKWASPFLKDDTIDYDFNGTNGVTTVDMMRKWDCSCKYTVSEDLRGLRFPYGDGSVAMDIYIADYDAEKNAVEIFDDMSTDERLALFAKLSDAGSDDIALFYLPKFKFESPLVELNAPLSDMGIKNAFMDNADFDMVDESLYVSKIAHKAVVDVDENGTKAAAATVIMANDACALEEEPINFIVDQPFVFTITDTETGTILFMGTIKNL